MKIEELYDIFKTSSGVTTDSRAITEGGLFFALKGENFDGNDFAVKALVAGASYAVVSLDRFQSVLAEAGTHGDAEGLKSRLIPVEDTLQTLQTLARYHRSVTFVEGKPLVVIGLTGTNGKTTTKELIRAVLSVKYNVTATEGNLNNSIGVPLTLLKINSSTEIAVVEMGASHPGDVKELCSVCLPNYGVITNVGRAHLLGFGSFEGVKKAKGELYDYLQRTADKAFLNADNPVLREMASQRPDLGVIPYGLEYSGASVLPASAENPFLRLSVPKSGADSSETRIISTHLIGAYNSDNVMAAIAVGAEFGVPFEDAAAAIEAYIPANKRSQLTDTGKNILIVDAYNANPSSMEAALNNFEAVESSRKMVMLGNMLELGEESVSEHVKVIERLRRMKLEAIWLVGEEFRKALDTSRIAGMNWFSTSEELASAISEEGISGVTVLVKGSRGSCMEKVIPVL